MGDLTVQSPPPGAGFATLNAMKTLSPSSSPSADRPVSALAVGGCTRGAGGIETLLSLAVLAAGLALAWSVAARVRQNARCDRFVAEIRMLSSALESCHRDSRQWPAATSEGEAPNGVAAHLPAGKWPVATALGGRYVWIPPAPDHPALLGITAYAPDAPLAVSPRQLRKIDALLDDGNLVTGRFRTGFNDWPIWQVAP